MTDYLQGMLSGQPALPGQEKMPHFTGVKQGRGYWNLPPHTP